MVLFLTHYIFHYIKNCALFSNYPQDEFSVFTKKKPIENSVKNYFILIHS